MEEYILKLKGSLKSLKGCSLKYKIKSIRRNLRYAWQRAWRGYDDTDVFDFNSNFNEKIIEILKHLKKYREGRWWVPDEYEKIIKGTEYLPVAGKEIFSEDQVDAILDTMIFHFKMCDEDYVIEKLYGHKIADAPMINDKFLINYDYKKIGKIIKQNQDAALKLFVLLFDNLWD